MTYQAPYAAWFTSSAGNTLQILNLWDDTPEPPRFSGDMEAFESSLVDGTRAFAEGLGSAMENRAFGFYKWFVDYEDMAKYQENLAVWLSTNQNGSLYLKFGNLPQWTFDAVITGYQFETENFLPPPTPQAGYLCLLVTLSMAVTNRRADASDWVFEASPQSTSVPAAGGEYQITVTSYLSPGQLGQGWKADAGEGLTVSDLVNGNNGSLKVQVSVNTTTAARSLYVTLAQDGTGKSVLVEFNQAAAVIEEKTIGSPVFLEGDAAKIAALPAHSWQQYRMTWGKQMEGGVPPTAKIKSVTVARGSANLINATLSLYVLESGAVTPTLLGTTPLATNSDNQQATLTFADPPEVTEGMQLIFQPSNTMFTHAEPSSGDDWKGMGVGVYPASLNWPDEMPAMSLDIEYIG